MSHAKLSPSSAHRWLHCAASVARQDGAPDESSEFADEGTAAHMLASVRLTHGNDLRVDVITVTNEDGTPRRKFDVTEEMESYVGVYTNAIRDRIVDDAQLFVEQKLDTGIVSKKYGPITGTGDAVIVKPSARRIEIHDLKYGRGVKVFARENPQLLLYALGVEHDYSWLSEVDEVLVAIHQPRLDHYDEHVYTKDELYAFGNDVCMVLDNLDVGSTEEVPGDWCKFCPRAAKCGALKQKADGLVALDFADLTEHGIAAAMDEVELVEIRCAAVRAEARRLLDSGVRVPGWMLAEGRQGNRKWGDVAMESQAAAVMTQGGVNAYKPQQVFSPSEVEKKFAKKWPQVWQALQPLIVRGAPSIQMVREGSKEPLASSVAGDFKDIAS